jgi:hypothetical protein
VGDLLEDPTSTNINHGRSKSKNRLMAFANTRTIDRFRSRLQRLMRLGRAHGQTRVAYRIVRKLTSLPVVRRCVRLSAVEVLSATVAELRSTGRIPKSFVVEKTSDEQELADYFGRADLVRERLARNDTCIVTRSGGKIGAGVWLRSGPNDYDENVDELGCVVRFPAGVAWSYDGKGTRWGAWGALMARLPEFLAELRVEDVYTLIDYDNQESLAGHRSLGYHRAGFAGCVALFGLSITACRPCGKRWRPAPGSVGKLRFIRHGNKPDHPVGHGAGV